MKYLYILLSLIIIIVTSIPQRIHAQELGLSITPAVVSFNIGQETDSILKETLNINNNSAFEQNLIIELIPFTVDPKGEILFNKKDDNTYKAINESFSITENNLPISTIKVYPNESKNISLNLNKKIAENMPDEYIFSIIFKQVQNDENLTSEQAIKPTINLTTSPAISTHVFIRKLTDLTKPVYTSSIVDGNIFFYRSAKLNIKLDNQNEFHIINNTNITIYNIFGKEILNEEIAEVLIPASSTIIIDNTSLSQVVSRLPWKKAFIPGIYTVKIQNVNPVDQILSTSIQKIYFIPIYLFLAIIPILIAIGVYIKMRRITL